MELLRWTAASRAFRLTVLLLGVTTLLLLPPPSSWRGSSDGGERRGRAGVPLGLLWTMMRSGSRLTQELLTAQPCSFSTEEPLRGRLAEGLNASIGVLQDLLACRISERPDLATQWINGSHVNLGRVRAMCRDYPKLCWDGVLLNAMCSVSCFRLVRVVAQGLSVAMALLQDHGSHAHVVHLVRDPRGMISSRRKLMDGQYIFVMNNKKEEFFHAEELSVAILCQRYRHDLAVATHLVRNNPDR